MLLKQPPLFLEATSVSLYCTPSENSREHHPSWEITPPIPKRGSVFARAGCHWRAEC